MGVRDSLFILSKYFMISCGLWKIPFQKKFIRYIYSIYSYFSRAFLTIITTAMGIQAYVIITTVNETDTIFGTLTVLAIYFDMCFKLFFYLYYRVPQMFVDVIREEKNIQLTEDERVKTIYSNQCKIYINTSILQIVSTTFAAYFYIATNLISFEMSSSSFMYELWMPFSINWKILATFKMFICNFGVLINTATHIGLQSLIIFVTTHLKILQINLDATFKNNSDNTHVHLKLGRIIERHQYLIKFVRNLNNSVKSIILLEFILNSVNLAAGMLQILTAPSVLDIVFGLVYLFLLISQLFVLAWSANEISIQSFKVSNAIYESNWMDQSESIKKIMLIMIMRAQKPLSLTIGSFRPMDLQAGIMTLKGAYSYAGVMR